MTANRFPTTRTGEVQQWLVPRDQFNAARYEGSDGDERRLFYVALTRARDWLSVSRHGRVNKNQWPHRGSSLCCRSMDRNRSRRRRGARDGVIQADAGVTVAQTTLPLDLSCG